MGNPTARKSPIGSGQQDVGHSGVATGRGVFHFRSSSSVGKKKTPTDGVSLYQQPEKKVEWPINCVD
ncbi:hypothetical protein [Rummeliibacillus suwonensis]|uniref:hypothetical protein n=1 Tax=Rummeliibacillus suwonensis TaxID=1306154 RepID=UPI001AAFE708|nr:hypothetical protein [Rummeliibacillus suwonensis]MBO2535097.1 hypothetical protein [Rummeliibacillus suwonensis]